MSTEIQLLRKNIYELQKQNKELMIRVKVLNEENYELRNNKKFVGWVENPDAKHIKDE